MYQASMLNDCVVFFAKSARSGNSPHLSRTGYLRASGDQRRQLFHSQPDHAIDLCRHLCTLTRTCLRNQDQQDDTNTSDNVRQPDVRSLIREAEQEWGNSQQCSSDKIKDQVQRHRDEPQGRNAALIVSQKTVQNEADTQNDRQNNSYPTYIIKSKNERCRYQKNTPDIIEDSMHTCWNETNAVHNKPFFLPSLNKSAKK